jgi:hypothetical protein
MSVPVLTSQAAGRRLSDAEDRVETARRALDRARTLEGSMLEQPRVEAAEAEVQAAEQDADEAREAAREYLYDFVFEPVGSALWRKLEAANPAPPEQKERIGKALGFDLEQFPIVAVAFCLKDPEIPSGELDAYRSWLADGGKGSPPLPPTVVKLQERIPENVWQQLWAAALNVNVGVSQVPSSLSGLGRTAGSVRKSEPQSS